MKQKQLIIIGGGIILVVIIALVAWFSMGGEETADTETARKDVDVVEGNPHDIVIDYYSDWQSAVESTDTDPYAEGLATSTMLSPQLRTKLAEATGTSTQQVDPVMCQQGLPSGFSTRTVSEDEQRTEVLVLAKDQGMHGQASVVLRGQDGGWYIDDIECSNPMAAQEREFTFVQTGALLKDVPEPYNSDRWHLVYEQDGQPGHAVPLFFDGESMCLGADGTSQTCQPSQFEQTTQVEIKGQMTEAGVEVKQLERME